MKYFLLCILYIMNLSYSSAQEVEKVSLDWFYSHNGGKDSGKWLEISEPDNSGLRHVVVKQIDHKGAESVRAKSMVGFKAEEVTKMRAKIDEINAGIQAGYQYHYIPNKDETFDLDKIATPSWKVAIADKAVHYVLRDQIRRNKDMLLLIDKLNKRIDDLEKTKCPACMSLGGIPITPSCGTESP